MTKSALAAKFTAVADPTVEADRLFNFLAGLPGSLRRRSVGPLTVIHGRDTLGTVHKLTQRLGGLSVASPLTTPRLHYDLRFSLTPDGEDLELTVGEKHAAGLKGPWRRDGEAARASVRELCAQGDMRATFERVLALLAVGSTGAQAAAYPQLMKIITDTMQRLYPDVTCFHSEQARELPWQLAEVGRG